MNGLEVAPGVMIGCRCIHLGFGLVVFFLKLNFVVTVYFVRLHFSTAIEYVFYWSALNKINLDKVEVVRTLVRLYSY